jgi:hypothetical protein
VTRVPVVAVCPGSIPVSIHGFGVKAADYTKILTNTIHDVPEQKKLDITIRSTDPIIAEVKAHNCIAEIQECDCTIIIITFTKPLRIMIFSYVP